jgi:hypothetical protein
VTKRRVRAKRFHQGGDKIIRWVSRKVENLDLDVLDLLSIGLSRRR